MRRPFVERRDRVEQREARTRGALRIIVVGLGPAEVSHHAVAKILRDVTAEAPYRFGCGAMVPGDRLAPFLRVQLRGNRSRASQVAKQHRQMTPLTRTICRANLRRCRRDSVERGRALGAKSGLVSVIEGALLARPAKGRGALIAKPRARGIFGPALRAAHRLTHD